MDFKKDREIINEAIKNGYNTAALLALYIKAKHTKQVVR
jgi:hypothetical protein